MDEYSRITIENYCLKNPKTKKSKFLWELVTSSYDVGYIPDDWEEFMLKRFISMERNPELKEALTDLEKYLLGNY